VSNVSKGLFEEWTPSQVDFDRFAALSGDFNPIHVDPKFSARTGFGRTVAHGMLLYTRVWAAIRRTWPDRAMRAQTLMFPNPSFAGEALRIELSARAPHVVTVSVARADGAVGLSGECRLADGSSREPGNAHYRVAAPAGPGSEPSTGERLSLGATASLARAYSSGDIQAFAFLAGVDDLPETVPEPLIAALFSCLLGVEVPGPGTNYLKQEMEFLAPARIGEGLTAKVEITRLRPDKDLVDLATLCLAGDGTVICRGRALVLARDVGKTR